MKITSTIVLKIFQYCVLVILFACFNNTNAFAQCDDPAGGVIVSEVAYYPTSGYFYMGYYRYGGQWFEITNTSNSDIDISDWVVGFKSTWYPQFAWYSYPGYTGYWSPPSGTTIAAGETITIGGNNSGADITTYQNPDITAHVYWRIFTTFGGIGIWDDTGTFVDGVKWGSTVYSDAQKLQPPDNSGASAVDFTKVYDFGATFSSRGTSLQRCATNCETLFAVAVPQSQGATVECCPDPSSANCDAESIFTTALDEAQAKTDVANTNSNACDNTYQVYTNKDEEMQFCTEFVAPGNPQYSYIAYEINLQSKTPANCGGDPMVVREVYKEGVLLPASSTVTSNVNGLPTWEIEGGVTYQLCINFDPTDGTECTKVGKPCFAPFYVIPPCDIDSIKMMEVVECFDNGTELETDDYVSSTVRVFYNNLPPNDSLILYQADGGRRYSECCLARDVFNCRF